MVGLLSRTQHSPRVVKKEKVVPPKSFRHDQEQAPHINRISIRTKDFTSALRAHLPSEGVMKYSAQSYSELLLFERGAIHALNT